MRRLSAEQHLQLIFIVLLTLVFAQRIQASSHNPTIKPRGPASYQLNPSTILWPPDCTTQDTSSCIGSEAVKSCTVEYCSKKVALTCWTHAYYIDFQCLCKSMSSTSCASCNAGINQELYLAWLSIYCQLSPGWNGLPDSWNAALPGYEILETGQVNAVSASDSSHFQTNNPFTSQFITDKHTFIDNHYLPTCTSTCGWLNTKWTSSFVDGSVAVALDGQDVMTVNYQIGGAPQSGTLYVDLSVFCLGWSWSDLQSNCNGLCTTNLDPTSLLLWLNTTCGQITGFMGLPEDWHDSLAIVNSTFSDAFPGPSCLEHSSDSTCQINATESSCTKSLCGSVDQNGDCSSVSMVDMQCYCSQIKYSSCISNGGACSSGLDETGLLLWLNTTCGSVEGFVGLPDNWHDSLVIPNSTYSDPFPGPSCAGENNSDCLSAPETSCTRTLCSSVDASGDCTSVTMVSMPCFCSSFEYSNCIASTGLCNSGLEETGFLLWLNNTCGSVAGFTGMPSNWGNSLAVVNSTFSDVFSGPSCLANNPDCQISATESNCTRTLCNHVDANGDCSSISMVSMPCFCSNVQYNNCISTGPCSSTSNETGLLIWLNNTCGTVPSFAGMPSNWINSLSEVNSSYVDVGSFPWPSCLSVGNYSDCQLRSLESSCTKSVCNGTDTNGDCSSVTMVNMECFCSQVRYGTSCKSNCVLSWQRPSYLNWLNDVCSSQVAPGTSLPLNWTSLPSVERSDILPWSWQLASDLPTSDPSRTHCPSDTDKLLAFAAVNLAMVLLVPIIGRRTVIKKLTFGYFGRQESQRWYFTGPLGVGLHLVSNAINAVIIQRTPGYEHTSIKDLTFFWCTRPRLAWFIVALLPLQAERSMYLSATASILCSEVILQFFAGVYMGIGTNHARREKFLLKGHLVGSWYAKKAMIMYAGSILWLAAVPFAILACLWSVLGVSERIRDLGEYWTETKKVTNTYSNVAAEEVGKLRSAKAKMKPPGQGPWQQQIESLQNGVSTGIDASIKDWGALNETWNGMPTELRRAQNSRRIKKREVQKARDRLGRSEEGTQKWHELQQATQIAEDAEMVNTQDWFTTTPQARQREARQHREKVDLSFADDERQRAEVKRIMATCERGRSPIERATEGAEAGIAADDAAVKSIKTVLDCWDELLKAKRELRENWTLNEDQWRVVAEKRRAAKVTKPRMEQYPIVVLVGMLLCWIGQWLWWAGFVEVAGDGYCPPKLPTLASIWTIFSSMGAIFGTSF